MAPRLGCISPPRERAATFLLDDSSSERLVQLHDRLPRGSQAAWRRSRSRNVVDDQRGAVEHKHTYIHVHVLSYGGPKEMAAISEIFALLWEKTGELSDGCFSEALV